MNSSSQFHSIVVEINQQISETSALLSFRRDFEFKAGQVINLTTNKNIQARMYSIASAEKDERVDVLYKIIPDGKLTPRLIDLQKGDKILISQPFGKFFGTEKPAWFIATGTGIAPFLSMLRSGIHRNKILIHGSRSDDDFYFSAELNDILNEHYIRCYSGKEKTENYLGRVTDFLSQYNELPKDNKYYLCGSAEMVVETRDLLIDKGIPFQQILSEIYF
jgi:ferredoxin--NADP+ reductase